MKIIVPDNAFDRLTAATNNIIFGYKDRTKAKALLEGVQDLELSSEPIFDENRRTATISPISVGSVVQYDYFPIELSKGLAGYKPREIVVSRFKGDEDVYQIAKRNSDLKIIEDKYSARRGAVLFEYISEIEKGLRQNYHTFYNTDELKRSRYHNSKAPDHFITYYTLSEMVNEQLLAPSSREYFLELLKSAVSIEEKVMARDSTRLEELEIPFSPDDLKKFITIRNAVMHFRVVTHQELTTLLDLAQRYQHYSMIRVLKLLQPTGTVQGRTV